MIRKALLALLAVSIVVGPTFTAYAGSASFPSTTAYQTVVVNGSPVPLMFYTSLDGRNWTQRVLPPGANVAVETDSNQNVFINVPTSTPAGTFGVTYRLSATQRYQLFNNYSMGRWDVMVLTSA